MSLLFRPLLRRAQTAGITTTTRSNPTAAFGIPKHRSLSSRHSNKTNSWSQSRSVLPDYNRQRHAAGNSIGFYVIAAVGILAGTGSAIVMAYCEAVDVDEQESRLPTSSTKSSSSLRTESFPFQSHSHGKSKVRILKVVKDPSDPKRHSIYEFSVTTTLFAQEEYEKSYTKGDNTNLVATDTQKNSVYLVAKRCQFDSPEGFGALLCKHFLKEYPMLDAVDVKVDQVVWDRYVDADGQQHEQEHDHGFVKTSPETFTATVSCSRSDNADGLSIQSSLSKMTVLKTTQSGFEGYLQDSYTLLPPTKERCMATELDASWTYNTTTTASGAEQQPPVDYNATRQRIRSLVQKGIFGPAVGGVYSPSLQATVYDAACMVLTELPHVESITIYTPNMHYLPCKVLDQIGEKFEDDIFIPTSEPSGTITCTVVREKQ
jgi:urate oxidase